MRENDELVQMMRDEGERMVGRKPYVQKSRSAPYVTASFDCVYSVMMDRVCDGPNAAIFLNRMRKAAEDMRRLMDSTIEKIDARLKELE